MSAKKILNYLHFVAILCTAPTIALFADETPSAPPSTLAQDAVANELGWMTSDLNHCGGFYVDAPFTYPMEVDKKESVEVTSNQGLLSQRNTSTLQGQVTVTRSGQQITSNKAYLYRNLQTGKLSYIHMIGNVHLREPNTLVIGKEGTYNFETKAKSLQDIIYRTSLNNMHGIQFIGSKNVTQAEREKSRTITALTAWGHATEFAQQQPRVYEMYGTSYSTCPPLNPSWHIQASHITLNKNNGRGSATHARLYIKSVPVLYFPYLSFSIDRQRKSGFLTPTVGSSNRWGAYVIAPVYWNIAPNYDMTLSPGLLAKRGFQFAETFRYLNNKGSGLVNASILPNDRDFAEFKRTTAANSAYSASPYLSTQAEFNRLMNDNDTRKDLIWRDNTHFNANWSSHIDFNYAGDDYYLEDFGGNLNEVTQNQLLQEADLFYKSTHWSFTTTLQSYQTLNPINQTVTNTQYRRLPQFLLNADYPDTPGGVEYFMQSEATHFDLRNTPGQPVSLPVGNRFNLQPGASLPVNINNFYINPRVQVALTEYSLYQNYATATPSNKKRGLPIFDLAMGVTLSRSIKLFGNAYQQTLEPEFYYDYIPYKDQSAIPTFDTTLNTLAYDQLFNYNRFSGIDRIGDANQVSAGISSRFIDTETGYQKIRLGLGEIFYFADRRVTLCNTNVGAFGCSDYPGNPANQYSVSPITGQLDYRVNPSWSVSANPIFDPITKQLVNSTVSLLYAPDIKHAIGFSYSYVRNGDVLSGATSTTAENNLKLTDFTLSWPLVGDVSAVGRFSEDWNLDRLQNLIYGLQYDTCCWAVRAVGAKTFVGLNPNNPNKFQYDTQFYIQFDLKGLTNIQTADPTNLLTNITGYNTRFGQDV